ncbi:hypothetical protein KY345_05350 [Candidatus Woesearchaeota archaeon]|nr:hypothetical protein [Candidatus Woesearchaeota archaeon]
MPDHISSSLYTGELTKVDTKRLRGFMRGMVTAERKIKEKELAREDLKKHIAKVKKLAAGKRPSLGAIKKHISEIEDKVNNVLQKEAKLLRSSAYENKTIVDLRKRIKELEEEISLKELHNKNLLKLNEDNINKLSETIDALQKKIESYISTKTERERRMKELEDKIRRKVEVKGVDERLAELEKKYAELKQREDIEEEDLERVKHRIDHLKTEI